MKYAVRELVCKIVVEKPGYPSLVLQGRRRLSIAARATTRVAQGRDEPCHGASKRGQYATKSIKVVVSAL